MRIIHISDLHLDNESERVSRCNTVAQYLNDNLNQLGTNILVNAGDIVQGAAVGHVPPILEDGYDVAQSFMQQITGVSS